MKYLIVTDSAGNGRSTRAYLGRVRGVQGPPRWGWTFQREEAKEFISREQAQRIIETKMRLKSGILILPVGQDPHPVAGS